VKLTLRITIPRPSFQPQDDVARLLERLAWALHRESEGLGSVAFVEGHAEAIGDSTLLITELKKD
jgi:hypothetical protein